MPAYDDEPGAYDSEFDADGHLSPEDRRRFGDDADQTSTCPACGEEIYDDVDICPSCGEAIIRRSPARRWAGGVAILVVLGMVLAAGGTVAVVLLTSLL